MGKVSCKTTSFFHLNKNSEKSQFLLEMFGLKLKHFIISELETIKFIYIFWS